eukprot:CAMPEP_0113235120 /NCGR_PEP_ID=MMETSP0008_2-20120614/3388_1 /TAXON_ID=97485 /ORGANISM="Prymnesium parvum" /LENGTH=161 /DNA_ID=CAMNT_0000082029 /DNA_START=56 /DNA_END=538 /DNA_ORIENTATION=- /assembly_acc=CAM_ASM_000153
MVELVSVKSRILIASMSRYDSAHASSTPPVTARHHVPSSCPVCCKSSVEIFRDLALRKTNPTTTTKMTDKFNVHARMILQPLFFDRCRAGWLDGLRACGEKLLSISWELDSERACERVPRGESGDLFCRNELAGVPTLVWNQRADGVTIIAYRELLRLEDD